MQRRIAPIGRGGDKVLPRLSEMPHVMSNTGPDRGVTLVGCGYVADLYMRSFALHPEVPVLGAWDRDRDRLSDAGIRAGHQRGAAL